MDVRASTLSYELRVARLRRHVNRLDYLPAVRDNVSSTSSLSSHLADYDDEYLLLKNPDTLSWCSVWPTMQTLSDYLITDDLTIILSLVAAGLFLLHNLYKPQSLVHPILLGRQSDVARVRNSGESAVYRNYGTGMMGRVRNCSSLFRRHFANATFSFPSDLLKISKCFLIL